MSDHDFPSWPPGQADAELEHLADRYIQNNTLDLAGVLSDPICAKTALVSSFGAESVVLIHMVLQVSPQTPVLFLDTGKHFEETTAYVETLESELGIENLIRIQPDPLLVASEDPQGTLHKTDPNLCCMLRKTFPLQDALTRYGCWITGRKRYTGGSRANIPFLERDGDHIKINPMIHETPETISTYRQTHQLPVHTLFLKGYPSIGCAPCTSKVKAGDDPRAGRWAGNDKVECGIHLGPDGRFTRKSNAKH